MKGFKKHLSLMRSDNNKPLKLPHHAILTVKPDEEWTTRTHIKTTFKDRYGRLQWFHVKHSYDEVLDMYYEVKKNIGRR